MTAPMQWTVTTHAMPYMLTMLAREHGTLHLAYDLLSDTWTVANDAGYAASRANAVAALWEALAPYDEGDADAGGCAECARVEASARAAGCSSWRCGKCGDTQHMQPEEAVS